MDPLVLAMYGIHLPQGVRVEAFAQDAQIATVTTPNGGIPSFLLNYMDPKIIDVLVAPMKAAEIVGETKKGDWTTETATFPVIESTGETSSYGDYSENGSTGVNSAFPQRQSYHYQTMTQWGEMQLEKAGLAGIDWASRVNIASILTLNKYQNKTYFFGVAGLQNYGLLNDPNLPASITPTAQFNDAGTTAAEVFENIRLLFVQLQTQCNGTIDQNAPMTLTMSPTVSVAMNKTNEFNVNVTDQLKKNFPNLKFITAVEYSLPAGELVQLMADAIDGQETATCAYTEKMRAHRIVLETSSYKQKKSQGTFGTIIYRPFAIASMLGV
jgi:hypothetical protein